MANAKRYQTDPDGRVEAQTEIQDEAFRPEPITVTPGTPAVIDLGPAPYGFAVMLNGGTATYRQCDSAGTAVPGAPAAVSATNAALVQRPWRWVLVTATTQPCVVCPL